MSDFPFLEALVLEGVYSAYWVVWPMPVDNIRSMLPSGLKLGKQHITLESKHPVLLAFGQHRHARLTEFQFLFDNVTYLESSISIPFVQFKEEQQESSGKNFIYMPRLYLNNFRATLGGNLFWGFNKELGNINPENQFSQTYQVNSYIYDQPITSLNFEISGNCGNPSDFLNFSVIRKMMDQPLALKTMGGVGPYVRAHFDWNFDKAKIQPIKATVNIFQQYVPGLELGTFSVEGIDKVELGAFQMENPWVLHLPSLVS
jgi:Acetoacetate decarboxylase (ADC)